MSDTRREFMAGVASTAAATAIPSTSEGKSDWADYDVYEDLSIVEIQGQDIKASQIPPSPSDIGLDGSYSLWVRENTIQGPLRLAFQEWDRYIMGFCALYNEGQEPPERPSSTDLQGVEFGPEVLLDDE